MFLGCVLAAVFVSWSARFPQIACRVPHFDERMSSPDRDVRLVAVRLVTHSEARNSRLFPPFFRLVLRDPDPEIAWTALSVLGDHDLRVNRDDVPATIAVPLAGTYNTRSAEDLQRLRKLAAGRGPIQGWAIRALALIGDEEAARLAEPLTKSPNPFTRFNAAVALLRAGNSSRANEVLRALVASNESAYGVRAAELLVRRGDRSALDDLRGILKTSRFAQRANEKDEVRDIIADLTGTYPR